MALQFVAVWGMSAKNDDVFGVKPLLGMQKVYDFRGSWEASQSGDRIVPFADFSLSNLTIRHIFPLYQFDSQPETLYLHLYGVGAEAEIWLNDKLLEISHDPFQHWILPVSKKMLRPAGNVLELRLRKAIELPQGYPRQFCGAMGTLELLRQDSIRPIRLPALAYNPQNVLSIAPWPYGGKFSVFPTEMRSALLEIKQSGVQVLHFPFAPPLAVLEETARLGFQIAPDLSGAQNIAHYRAYPLADGRKATHMTWWRDKEGNNTPSYGKFLPVATETAEFTMPANRLALLLLLLIPWIGLLATKFFAPRINSSLGEFLTKTQIQIELIGQNKFLRQGQSLLITLFRFLVLALIISIYLYYLQLNGRWDDLNILSEESMLYEAVAHRDYPLAWLFLLSLAWIAAANLVKYIFLTLMSWVYRVNGLTRTIVDLDILASMPMNLVVAIPPAFLFFSGATAGGVIWIVFQVLIVLYFLRRLVLVYQGLTQLFSFSSHLKFLYICALEILPWVILI